MSNFIFCYFLLPVGGSGRAWPLGYFIGRSDLGPIAGSEEIVEPLPSVCFDPAQDGLENYSLRGAPHMCISCFMLCQSKRLTMNA